MDWQNTDLFRYLLIGCGAIAVLAIILYFLPVRRLRVPAVILGVLMGAAAGFGGGVLAVSYYGYAKGSPSAGGEGGGGLCPPKKDHAHYYDRRPSHHPSKDRA